MLVLARRIDEAIDIGHDTRVVVLGLSGNRVSLGILAPREVPIRRSELPPRNAQETETDNA